MLIEKMAKAYSYIRFSTAIQAAGDSMRRQSELSAQYAATHGLYDHEIPLDFNFSKKFLMGAGVDNFAIKRLSWAGIFSGF